MNRVRYTEYETSVVLDLYPTLGSLGVQRVLKHRTRASIKNVASKLGIPSQVKGVGFPSAQDFSGVPVHDYTQPDIAARSWHGPVNRDMPLRWKVAA
jgi:hypothetical protein